MLTRKDIDNYQKSQNQEFKHELEKNSLNSSFESDALDGYTDVHTNTTDLGALDKKFLPKFPWIWTISIATNVLFFSTFIWLNTQDNVSSQKVLQTKNSQIDRSDVFIPQRIDTLTVLPSEEVITAKVLVQDFKEKITFNQEVAHASETEDQKMEPLPIQPLSDQTKTNEPISIQILGAEFYLYNLKLLDYRKYRSKSSIPTKEVKLSGTSADLENVHSLKEEDWESKDIPYVNYLDKTMCYFSKGQYKKALNRLEHILKTYPDDLNALFYAGLIQYNLDNSDEAFSLFEQCTKNKFSNFNEEARWYCALSRIRQKEFALAIKILEQIQAEKGFYANQAKKLLTEIR
ncbi:MAG: tetratricopeptide repeat protein [Cryomorphaceae bacterium]|nr:tetratricopeptide repeat protein [Cryomorphaceae bacterium]